MRRLSDKHVARLVQGLALAVISAAASASTGSKPPACQSAGGAVSSARRRCCLILHAIGWTGDLRRRVLGRAGLVCSASSRRCVRGFRAVLLSLSTSVLARMVERHRSIGVLAPRLAFRQQGRGHLAARLLRPRTPARQPGALVGQDGQPIAPKVIGGDPVRMGLRAPGHRQQRRRQPARETGRPPDPAYRIVHASRIASSISRSVTSWSPVKHASMLLHIRKEDQGASREDGWKARQKAFRRGGDVAARESHRTSRTYGRSRCHQFADSGGGQYRSPWPPAPD